MAEWQPAPTYDMPVQFQAEDPEAQALLQRLRTTFSPNWLNWFLELAALLTAAGGGGGLGFDHNLLLNLQGGTTDEYYHLTADQHSTLTSVDTDRLLGRDTAGTGDPEQLTISAVLDWIGSTRGSILYRGAAGWAILTPGTVGFALVSNGAGADPSYQEVAGTPEPSDPHWEPVSNMDPMSPALTFDAVTGDVIMGWVS